MCYFLLMEVFVLAYAFLEDMGIHLIGIFLSALSPSPSVTHSIIQYLADICTTIFIKPLIVIHFIFWSFSFAPKDLVQKIKEEIRISCLQK